MSDIFQFEKKNAKITLSYESYMPFKKNPWQNLKLKLLAHE